MGAYHSHIHTHTHARVLLNNIEYLFKKIKKYVFASGKRNWDSLDKGRVWAGSRKLLLQIFVPCNLPTTVAKGKDYIKKDIVYWQWNIIVSWGDLSVWLLPLNLNGTRKSFWFSVVSSFSAQQCWNLFFFSICSINLFTKKTNTEFLLWASSICEPKRAQRTHCGKLRTFTLQPLGLGNKTYSKGLQPSLTWMPTLSCLYEEMAQKGSLQITV